MAAETLGYGLASLFPFEIRLSQLRHRLLKPVSAELNLGFSTLRGYANLTALIRGSRLMPKPCSLDLRMRLLDAVIAGASRREAAERFEVSASSGVKWLQRWEETGSIAAKPTGGSISPLEQHAKWLLALITEQPDLTLDEVVAAMRKRRIAGSRSAVWRLFARHGISFKKKPTRSRARASRRGPRPPALDARARYV